MLTTQVQVLFYVGNIQLVSCSIFVPIPNIIIRSHQTLEAILPHLPIPLLTSKPADQEQQEQQLLGAPESPTESSPCSQALVRSPSSLVLRSRNGSGSLTTHHSCSSGGGAGGTGSAQSSNRISPDSSIPATTCIKFSLQPTPSLKFVKPRCPHIQQKQRNQRYYRQQQQQQEQEQEQQPQPQSAPYPHSHSRSHSRSHSHCRHRSHSHQSPPSLRRCNNMISSTPETVVVTFTYPVSSSSSTPVPEVVQVTGNFNAWQRSEPLRKNEEASCFEGEVTISLSSIQDQVGSSKKKVMYKFILDGNNWVTDPDQELDRDYAGNLNNVLFLDARSSRISDSFVQSPTEFKAPSTPTVVNAQESEEERLARIKQEEEDDATIRELGGGMWGMPLFDVNNPAQLPEHFSSIPEQDEAVPDDATAEDPVASPVTIDTQSASEDKQQEEEEKDDDEHDRTIEELARGGMWGTPYFQINDSTEMPEQFIEALNASHPSAKINARTTVESIPEEALSVHDGCSTYGDIQESVTQIIEVVQDVKRAPAGLARPMIDESADPVPSRTNSRTNSAITATELSSVSGRDHLDEAIVGPESEKGDKGDGESGILLLQSHPSTPMVSHKEGLAGDAKPTADFSAATLTIAIPDKVSAVAMTAPNTPITTAPPTPSKNKRWSMSSVTASVSTSGLDSRSSSSTTISQKSEKVARRKSIWNKVKKALA